MSIDRGVLHFDSGMEVQFPPQGALDLAPFSPMSNAWVISRPATMAGLGDAGPWPAGISRARS
jgi:hypothetical protein